MKYEWKWCFSSCCPEQGIQTLSLYCVCLLAREAAYRLVSLFAKECRGFRGRSSYELFHVWGINSVHVIYQQGHFRLYEELIPTVRYILNIFTASWITAFSNCIRLCRLQSHQTKQRYEQEKLNSCLSNVVSNHLLVCVILGNNIWGNPAVKWAFLSLWLWSASKTSCSPPERGGKRWKL